MCGEAGVQGSDDELVAHALGACEYDAAATRLAAVRSTEAVQHEAHLVAVESLENPREEPDSNRKAGSASGTSECGRATPSHNAALLHSSLTIWPSCYGRRRRCRPRARLPDLPDLIRRPRPPTASASSELDAALTASAACASAAGATRCDEAPAQWMSSALDRVDR